MAARSASTTDQRTRGWILSSLPYLLYLPRRPHSWHHPIFPHFNLASNSSVQAFALSDVANDANRPHHIRKGSGRTILKRQPQYTPKQRFPSPTPFFIRIPQGFRPNTFDYSLICFSLHKSLSFSHTLPCHPSYIPPMFSSNPRPLPSHSKIGDLSFSSISSSFFAVIPDFSIHHVCKGFGRLTLLLHLIKCIPFQSSHVFSGQHI